MKRNAWVLAFPLLMLSAAQVCAQANVPDSAIAEIIRRGDLVTHTGEGLHGSTADKFAEIMAVPEDDSHKWFISIITSPNCGACDKLKADWKTSAYLLAFANPDDAKQSWAHYRVYRSDDATQGWRWKAIRIASYPTILIQPPRNRRFGDPGTVVMQVTGYDGDAKQLATAMSAAIRKYVEKVTQTNRTSNSRSPGNQQALPDTQPNIGYDPPFTPITPSVDVPVINPLQPNQPLVIPPVVQPVVQPQVTPSILSLLFQALGGTLASQALPSLLLMVLIGVQIWRAFRKSTNQPLLLDDATFERIRQILLGLMPSQDNPANPPTINTKP